MQTATIPIRSTGAARRWIVFSALAGAVILTQQASPLHADMYWTGGNQLEYSLAREGGEEILENWFDLELASDALAAGVRYEIFQPHEMSPDSTKQGIHYKYLSYSSEHVSITAGNFYGLFGRGLALRAYEDRGVRRDSNLEGVKLELRSGPAEISMLTGKALNQNDERRDLLHGLDVDVEVADFLRLGGSYLSNRAPRQPGTSTNELGTVRAQIMSGPFDLYVERGERNGLQGFCAQGQRRGRGFYGAASLNIGPFGISVEHKDYKGFRFLQSDCATEYNLPPALVREHAFTLLNRHPHELNSDDEKGSQVEILASAGGAGDFTLSFSKTDDQEGNLEFQETYAQWDKMLDNGQALAAVDFTKRPDQKEITIVTEGKIWFREEMSAKVQVQHQHVDGPSVGQYDDEFLLLEYSPSMNLTVAMVGEYTNKSEVQRSSPDEKTRWLHLIVTRNIADGHYLSVMYGTRQAGFVCAGGVCRYEPEFDGLEFKLFSTF
jgi:hypothetical protein